MGLQSETAWFAQVMTDQAFFHGTLLIGLTFVALVRRPFSVPPECFYHYNEAIKYTSANLEDEESQMREGTIAAVTCLAAFEVNLPGLKYETIIADLQSDCCQLQRKWRVHSSTGARENYESTEVSSAA